jgi:hypothetical protein
MNIHIICSAQINENAPLKDTSLLKKTQNKLIYDQHLRHIIFFTLKQVEHSIASRSKECWQSYSNLLKPNNPKMQELKLLRSSSGIKIGDISGISPHVDSLTEHKISEAEILKKLLLPPLLSEYVYNSSYSSQCNCKEFSKILNHNSSNPTIDIELSNGIISRYINSKLLQYNIRVFKYARFLDIFYTKFYKRTMENESDYFKITDDFTDSINEFMNSAENNEQLNINIIDTLDLYHSIFSDFTETINKILESMTENSQKESKTNVKNCPKINHMDTDTIIGVLKNILNKIQIQCEYINKFKNDSKHLIIRNEQLDNNRCDKLNQSMYNKTSLTHYKQHESHDKMTASACKLTYGEDDLLFKDAQIPQESTIQTFNSIEESEPIVNIQEIMESVETIEVNHEQLINSIARDNINEPIKPEQINTKLFNINEQMTLEQNIKFTNIQESTTINESTTKEFEINDLIVMEEIIDTHNQSYYDIEPLFYEFHDKQAASNFKELLSTEDTQSNASSMNYLNYKETKSEEDCDSIIDELNNSDDIILEEPEEYDSIIIDIKSIKKSQKIQHFDNYGKYSRRSIIEEIPEENESAQQTESEATDNESDFNKTFKQASYSTQSKATNYDFKITELNKISYESAESDNESDFQKQLMERRKAYEEKFKNQSQDQIINEELTTQFMKSRTNESMSETLEDKVKNLTTSTIDSSVIDSTYINYEQEQYQPEEVNTLFNRIIYPSDEVLNHDEIEQPEELRVLFNQPVYSSDEELANNEIEQRITQIEHRMHQSEQLYNEQFMASLHNDQLPLHNEELPQIINEPARNEPIIRAYHNRPINQDNARPVRQLSSHEAINNMPDTSINLQKSLIVVILFIILPALIISWIIICIIVK